MFLFYQLLIEIQQLYVDHYNIMNIVTAILIIIHGVKRVLVTIYA